MSGSTRLVCSLLLILSLQSFAQQVEPAPRYEARFNRTRGWTGADGTYSYPIGDSGVLWSFSDTFFGPVVDGKRTEFTFANNSHIIQRGEDLEFLQAPSFVPPDRKGWFWMADGTYPGDFRGLLGQYEKDGSGVFGFRQSGLWYARAIPLGQRLVVQEYVKLPFFRTAPNLNLTFGSAVLRQGSWDYVYGIKDSDHKRSYVLARVPSGRMGIPGVWRFYDGESWSRDPLKVASLFDGASMESSVHKTRDGGYLYVGSLDSTDRIVARYAPSVSGPWGDSVEVYRAPEVQGEIFSYNAKAHPHLSSGGRLLISYNVNTRSLAEVIEKADIYRPRFIWWTPSDPGWLPMDGK